jgi:hypothetical protein
MSDDLNDEGDQIERQSRRILLLSLSVFAVALVLAFLGYASVIIWALLHANLN